MSSIRNIIRQKARSFLRALFFATCVHLVTDSHAGPPNQLQDCCSNLAGIYTAIQAYRTNNHRLPNSLRDLIPQYLPNANFLKCPAGTAEPSQAVLGSNREPV